MMKNRGPIIVEHGPKHKLIQEKIVISWLLPVIMVVSD